MNFHTLFCVASSLHFILLVTGCATEAVRAAADGEASQEPVAVKAVIAAQKDLRKTTTQPATVHAFHAAEIYAKVSGYVREIDADIGDRVEQEAVLATLELPEIEKQLLVADARIDRAKAQQLRAESQQKLAVASLESVRAGVQAARSHVTSNEATLKATEAEFARTQSMVDRGSLEARLLDEARERLERARSDLEAAHAAVQVAESKVAVAQAEVHAAEADYQASEADIQVALAEREQLQVMLDYGSLRAPFAGIVTERHIDPGDLVRAAPESGKSIRPHFVIAQTETLRVRTSVPESYASQVDVGDAVGISLALAGLDSIDAAVTRTAQSIDPQTRTLTVEVEIPNENAKILPGMYGEATVVLSEKAAAVMLPASAVRFRESGESFVYRLDADDRVDIVDVSLGYDDGQSIEITSNLSAGQRVIDAHLKRFEQGDLVRVIE